MSEIIRIKTIKQLYSLLNLGVSAHDQMALIRFDNTGDLAKYRGMQITTDFYGISLKNGIDYRLKYGRQYYDFDEGSLIYTAPEQVFRFENGSDGIDGWFLCFHPDLVRRSELGKHMQDYSFFLYEAHEALHISDQEHQVITGIVNELENEINNEVDNCTDQLIISNLELLLNYSKRFYERQFITRKAVNNDVISKFERLLKKYIIPENLEYNGLPSVKELAEELGYSPNYLSDMLRKETGKSTKEHIHRQLLEVSKTLLLNSSESVANISYMLGFGYPAHFSNFFKSKTGMSPAKYRKI